MPSTPSADPLTPAAARDAAPSVPAAPVPAVPAARPGRRHVPAWVDGPAEALLERRRASDDEDERHAILGEVVALALPQAHRIASRYRERGIPSDDLAQVAALGLVKAVHGYETGHQSGFLAYAVPTMRGEIKKHFRDHGWAVRPTRRVQVLAADIPATTQALSQDLGRSPTVRETAAAMGAPEDDVVEALVARHGYATSSLDAPHDDGGLRWADRLAAADDTMESLPDRVALGRLLAALPARERRILAMRYFGEKTQSEIGEEIGVTQMQVSRLLARTLAGLRDQLGASSSGGRG